LHIFHNVPVKEFLKFTKSIENIDKVINKSLVQYFFGDTARTHGNHSAGRMTDVIHLF